MCGWVKSCDVVGDDPLAAECELRDESRKDVMRRLYRAKGLRTPPQSRQCRGSHICKGNQTQASQTGGHCSLAYSALASFRMGMSGSASLQRAKKSWQWNSRPFTDAPARVRT